MDNRLPVRMIDRGADEQEQVDSLTNRQRGLVRVAGDRNPLDVFHDEIGTAVLCRSCVEKACDVGVFQACEDLALPLEPGCDLIDLGVWPDQLDGNLLPERFVSSVRKIDDSHTAPTEFPVQFVGPNPGTWRQFLVFAFDLVTGIEKRQCLGTQPGIVSTRLDQERPARVGRPLPGLVHQPVEATILVRREWVHTAVGAGGLWVDGGGIHRRYYDPSRLTRRDAPGIASCSKAHGIAEMSDESQPDLTRLINRMFLGDAEAGDEAMNALYTSLRRIASKKLSRERPGNILETRALVHEALLRLFGSKALAVQNRGHFMVLMCLTMKRVLIDRVRKPHPVLESLNETFEGAEFPNRESALAIDEILYRFCALDPEACRAFELKLGAGMTSQEIADELHCSAVTVNRRLQRARLWLRKEMAPILSPSAISH